MQDSPSLFVGNAPLAAKMRPSSLDAVLGQKQALSEGSPLRLLAQAGTRDRTGTSVILWGPPGTGKTTIARAVAASSGRRFVELSAVTAGVKELRSVIDASRNDQEIYSVATIVFLDEIHRFSKAQQDTLLPAVENGWIILIAATTENPSFSVIAPLLSRSLLVRLLPLSASEIQKLIGEAIESPKGLSGKISADEAVLERIAELAGGDARRALTILEVASARALNRSTSETAKLDLEDIDNTLEAALVRYDREGEAHYDTISAFIKSVRGSDPDAAIHYLARMLEGGEDPRFIARRLVLLASEDIGLADPSALSLAVACFDSVNLIGMPEGRIPLAEATIYLSLAPKSNSAYLAIDAAIEDIRGGFQPPIPFELRGSNTARSGATKGYDYPHDDPRGVLEQDYLSERRDYYQPKNIGSERDLIERLSKLRRIILGDGA